MPPSRASRPSRPSVAETLGLHTKELKELLREWTATTSVDRRELGVQVFEALLNRQDPFYYAKGKFDYHDHPFKAYPIHMEPEITMTDALVDMVYINAGDNVDAVGVSTGALLTKRTPSGKKMSDALLRYTLKPSPETLKKVILPLSMPVLARTEEDPAGVGKFDPIAHFPENSKYYLGATEEWGTAVVAAPAFTEVHHDHLFCGQFMAHLFGKKVWVMAPSNEETLAIIGVRGGELKDDEHLTVKFVKGVKNLLVWVCDEPHLFMNPPRGYHSVFTLETAAHMGIRLVCLDWREEVITVAKWIKENAEAHLQIPGFVSNLLSPDLRLWAEWTEDPNTKFQQRDLEVLQHLKEMMDAMTKKMEASAKHKPKTRGQTSWNR